MGDTDCQIDHLLTEHLRSARLGTCVNAYQVPHPQSVHPHGVVVCCRLLSTLDVAVVNVNVNMAH